MSPRRRRPTRPPAGERGSALVEAVWLTLLLLVPLVYVLMATFDVQRAAYGVSGAARAAARAYSLSPDEGSAAARARAAAAVTLRDQHLPADAGAGRDPGLRWDVRTTADAVQVQVSAPLELPLAPPGWRGGTVTGRAAAYVAVSD